MSGTREWLRRAMEKAETSDVVKMITTASATTTNVNFAKSGGVFTAESRGVFRDGGTPSPPELFKTDGVSPSDPQLFKTTDGVPPSDRQLFKTVAVL